MYKWQSGAKALCVYQGAEETRYDRRTNQPQNQRFSPQNRVIVII